MTRARHSLLRWHRMFSPDSLPTALKPGKRILIK